MGKNGAAAPQRARKESSIQKTVLTYLEGLPESHWYNMHGNSFQGSGRPDIIGCLQGKLWAIELKRPGEQPTRIQAHELKKWNLSKAITLVATSLQEVKQAIQKWEASNDVIERNRI